MRRAVRLDKPLTRGPAINTNQIVARNVPVGHGFVNQGTSDTLCREFPYAHGTDSSVERGENALCQPHPAVVLWLSLLSRAG